MKKSLKKSVVAMLCMTSALAVSAGTAIAVNGWNDGYRIEANADATSEALIDLSQKHTTTAGGFNANNTIFIWWASGVQNSGMSWGGMNMYCNEEKTTKFSDMITLTTYDGTEKTLTELASSITRVILVGDTMGINLEGALTKSEVKYVTLKAGLTPIDCPDDSGWGNNSATSGNPVADKALTADLQLYVNPTSEYLEKSVTSLALMSAPTKTTYEMGDSFVSDGMELTATYFDGSTQTVTVTADMCTYDFTTTGTKTVTIAYNDATYMYTEVTVNEPVRTLTSIAVKDGVTMSVEQYTSNVSLSADAKLVLTYTDGTEEVDLTTDMISGYGNADVGTATVTYGGATCEISYTITAYTGTAGITAVKYGESHDCSGGGFGVMFERTSTENLKALSCIEKSPSAITGKTLGDLVMIGDKTVNELIAEGKVARMNFYGQYLNFHIDDTDYMAEVKAGTYTISILPGFQWVTWSGDDWGNWAGSNSANYSPIEDSVVTETLYFALYDGVIVKAVESVSIADGYKTSYEKNETLDLSTLSLNVKYVGDTEATSVAVTSDMCTYDFSTVTDSTTVMVSYRGKEYTYTVEVVQPAKEVQSIVVKDGVTMSVEQYTSNVSLSENAKIVVSYTSDEYADEEIDLTTDMISGYGNADVGTATVTYKTITCDIAYTVTNYTGTAGITGINYDRSIYAVDTETVSVSFERTSTENLKALSCVNLSPSAIMGKTLGDLVMIGDKTVNELIAEGKVARFNFYGENMVFNIDNNDFMAAVKAGEYEISILPGFQWVTWSGDDWGNWAGSNSANYSPIEGSIVTEKMVFSISDNMIVKVVDSISLVGDPITQYYVGGILNISNLSLDVKYKGNAGNESVTITSDMCTYDFTESGTQTVTIRYAGGQVTYAVEVLDVAVTGIELEEAPDKTSYDFGIENELDLTGMVVNVLYSNGTSEALDTSVLTFSGFDSRSFGEQTITAMYGEFSVTFTVTVENISTNKYLAIDYHSSTPSYEASQHNSLVIPFILNGVYDDLGVFWRVEQYDYVGDYMLINGVTVSQLVAEGKVTRLCVWTNQLVIHLDTEYLVSTTWGENYVEGTSKLVETVTFLPGFQWYSPAVLSDSLWGDDSYTGAIALSGAVLKERIVLTNVDGYGWQRELKKNEDGTVADDAITIVSLPDKTEYVLGESLNIKGMKVLAKYEDGGEETISVGYSDVEGYKKNVLGEQTLTYTYNGASVTFTVTVVEEATSEEPVGSEDDTNSDILDSFGCAGGEGGCFGSIGSIGVAGVLMLGTGVALLKKKKENDKE